MRTRFDQLAAGKPILRFPDEPAGLAVEGDKVLCFSLRAAAGNNDQRVHDQWRRCPAEHHVLLVLAIRDPVALPQVIAPEKLAAAVQAL